MLIYVVEDDAASRDQLTRMLRTQEHEVVSFANAVQATDYIASHVIPDVALIDFKLESYPNGINLAKKIRLMFPHVAIVLISMYATPADVAIGFRQGIDDFLIRPVEVDELLNSISDAALRHRPAAQQITPANPVGELRINADTHKAYWHGVDLQLTPTEYALVTQLVARPVVIINYAELYSIIKGEHLSPHEARIRMKSHIANLKHKLLQAAPESPLPLRISWGHGVYWSASSDFMAENFTGEKNDNGE